MKQAHSAEAIEAHRELALLHRLAETIGASLDPAAIGPAVLDEARRTLDAEVAAIAPVAGTDGLIPPFVAGDGAVVARLLRDASAVIAAAAAGGGPSVTSLGASGAHAPRRSVVVAPALSGTRTRAVLVVARAGTAFTSGDLKLAVALARQAGIAFERAALHLANTDRLRLEHDLALGRRIQLGLLPQVLPRADGWEIGTAYEAAREVGGDFYDVFPVRGRRGSLALVIADVSGKGIPAALMMAFARPLLRAADDHSAGPAEALSRANRVLVEERRSALFITALHLRLALRTGMLRWASAGHEPPILVPGDGRRVRRLPAGGLLLGARRELSCAEHTTRLAHGDLLVAYTDGVTDARRADGERFGEARLTRSAREAHGLTAPDAARRILDGVHRFVAGAPAADDVAILTLRRTPTAKRS